MLILRSKSFWVACVAGVAGVCRSVGVEIPNEVFVALGSLSVIFLRLGMLKGGEVS